MKRDGTGSFNAGAITASLGLVGLSSSTTAAIGGSNSSTGWGVSGASAAGTAIYGQSSGSSGTSNGVEGVTSSGTAAGVVGLNNSTAVDSTGIYGYSPSYGIIGSSPGVGVRGYGSGSSGIVDGVQGISASSASGAAGVYGQLVSPSTWGITLPTASVWGDTGQSSGINGPSYMGVLGTAGDAPAGVFFNNSPTSVVENATLVAYNYDSSGFLFDAYNVSNGVYCNIDPGANLFCIGTYSHVVPLDEGKRKVAVSSIQSPENWFEDFGSAQLVNGVAVVQLDPDFIQTVNTEKNYRVFPVPNGDCRGLYVTNKTANSFEVHELGGGASNVSFDYRITAIRRKYGTVRFADHTNDPKRGRMLEEMQKSKPASSSDPRYVRTDSQAKTAAPKPP